MSMAPDISVLPDDPAILRATAQQLVSALREAQRRIQQLEHQIAVLKRSAFGKKSEKVVLDQLLLSFAKLTDEQRRIAEALVAAHEAEERAAKPPPKRDPHGRGKLPDHLPVEDIVETLTEAERACPKCGKTREKIGEEISERLEYEPSSFKRQLIKRDKFACKPCEGQVVTAEKPAEAIERCKAGPGLLSQVVVSKYGDHSPLNRQEEIYARHGIDISRSTLCDWAADAAQLLKPIAEAMHRDVLLSRNIHTDDTTVPVLDILSGGTRTGRAWVYVGDRDHPHDSFQYSPDRCKEHPREHLGDYASYLTADAYPGYDNLFADLKIREVACLAHARRKIYDAKDTDTLTGYTALAWIRKLYDVEDIAKNKTDEERLALRRTLSIPLLVGFKTWLDDAALRLPPRSIMGAAIGYSRNHWIALCRYTEQGFLSIDNNAAERALRAIALGRKNWLFAGSDQGGRTAAIHYTLISTCKRHDIDPWAYLKDVMMRVGTTPQSRIEELFPHRWKQLRADEKSE